MNLRTGKPDHIEDYLCQLHSGQWFGWSDPLNKVYANLIIHDQSKTKPTEQECNNGLAAMIASWGAKQYAVKRSKEYPTIGDQLDALFHAGVFPEDMAAKIQAVKDKYPKGGA